MQSNNVCPTSGRYGYLMDCEISLNKWWDFTQVSSYWKIGSTDVGLDEVGIKI